MTIKSFLVDGPILLSYLPASSPQPQVAENPPRGHWSEGQAPEPPRGNLNPLRGVAPSQHLYPRLAADTT